MNKALILKLSLFGLAMAVATVYVIPAIIEPVCWLVIFTICAIIIAKKAGGKYFLHGFVLSLVNCFWIVAVHILLYNTYIANHPELVTIKMPYGNHPRLMMLVTGPIVGILSGLVQGLFAFIASKAVKK